VNPGKILLVEDNPDDVALTMRALKSHNITNARRAAPGRKNCRRWSSWI